MTLDVSSFVKDCCPMSLFGCVEVDSIGALEKVVAPPATRLRASERSRSVCTSEIPTNRDTSLREYSRTSLRNRTMRSCCGTALNENAAPWSVSGEWSPLLVIGQTRRWYKAPWTTSRRAYPYWNVSGT